jgi:5-methylcytosine-specific restriction enzyme subunit McrC
LYKNYVQVNSFSSFPKGRILMSETVEKFASKGIQHQIVISRFQQIIDNPINRCLKYAVWYISQRYKSTQSVAGSRKILQELNRVYQLLASVKLDYSQSFLKDPLVQEPHKLPSIRSYYLPGIALAKAIILGQGIEIGVSGNEVVLASLIWNLEASFESYLRAILKNLLKGTPFFVIDSSSSTKSGAKPLFDTGEPTYLRSGKFVTPDITIASMEEGSQKYVTLIEVKYKDISDIKDEINQVLTYAISYRCPNVVLAHPKIGDQATGLLLGGKIDNITLYHYVFDLAADDLDKEEKKFADAMQDLAQASSSLTDTALVLFRNEISS